MMGPAAMSGPTPGMARAPMPTKVLPIVPLAELAPGQEADVFALLYLKEELRTKDNKPYYRVGFRDATREIAHNVQKAAVGTGEVALNIVSVLDASSVSQDAAAQVFDSARGVSEDAAVLRDEVQSFLAGIHAA